ncbi:MAG: hypothetical protein EOP85_21610, partial [Verrucomicrobiaceae bacterium]
MPHLLAVEQNRSPSDITFVSYDENGKFLAGGASPHHGDYPGASKTWVFPSEERVVDSSGTIYSTTDLTYSGSLGTQVDAIDFLSGSRPVVVKGNVISTYTNGLLPHGSATLSFEPASFHLQGPDAVVFGADNTKANGIRVEVVPLASIGTPPADTAVNPRGLPYTPDAVYQAANGTLLLVSNMHRSIFRWSPETRDYLETVPLAKIPAYSAYSASGNVVYLADGAGVIRSIDLDDATPVEQPFAVLPTPPLGLAVTGNYVLAADSSGAWCTHRTFTTAGTQVSSKEWNYYSKEYVWSDAAQKLFHFRDDTSPNDLLAEQINANGSTYEGLAPGAIAFSLLLL